MTIREQAEYHRILLAMGIGRREDVIEWADQLVLCGAAPVEVIDVCLAVDVKEYELDALLRAVPGGGDLGVGAHAALGRFEAIMEDLPLRAAVDKVAAYGRIAVIPEEERQEAALFDVLYEDMVAGYCGSENELLRMLEDFVSRYAERETGGGGVGRGRGGGG